MDSITRTRPFLKWAGGKFKIINKIRTSLPKGSCLIEPFVGSGAVFLNTDYSKYLLADINADLINLFKYLKLEKRNFIHFCKQFFSAEFNTKDTFLLLRSEFNTAFGDYKKPYFPENEMLVFIQKAE